MKHHISVYATFDDEKATFEAMWEKFNDLALQLGDRDEIDSINVMCQRLDETSIEDEEYFDEYTLFKVFEVLKGFDELSQERALDVIKEMESAGILFRERGPRS